MEQEEPEKLEENLTNSENAMDPLVMEVDDSDEEIAFRTPPNVITRRKSLSTFNNNAKNVLNGENGKGSKMFPKKTKRGPPTAETKSEIHTRGSNKKQMPKSPGKALDNSRQRTLSNSSAQSDGDNFISAKTLKEELKKWHMTSSSTEKRKRKSEVKAPASMVSPRKSPRVEKEVPKMVSSPSNAQVKSPRKMEAAKTGKQVSSTPKSASSTRTPKGKALQFLRNRALGRRVLSLSRSFQKSTPRNRLSPGRRKIVEQKRKRLSC